ncbi:MAG: DPP IV N-terminal domain-containing protein, partial [Egibacteraceae bacterium]
MAESEASASFPRRWAATRRFTLGRPRAFAVAPDGSRVAFLRSRGGDDPVQRLWVSEPATGAERCVLDPDDLEIDERDLPAEERARRERTREQAGGVVGFATDRVVRHAAVPLGGRVLLVDLVEGTARDAGLDAPVVDPRLSPDGRRLAFVRDGGLHVVELDGEAAAPVTVAASAEPDVTWGLAEFVAAEEMRRTRGFWWSPDGGRLAAARVDVGPVARWHLADPVDPDAPPRPLRFPAAGQANADVSLAIVGPDAEPVAVDWDRVALPYLAAVTWPTDAPLTIAVQSRDQRTVEVRTVGPDDGATTLVARLERAPWVELVAGTPRWAGGRLLTVRDDDDAGAGGTRRLYADDEALTPEGLQVRSVLGASRSAALITASAEDPTEIGVWSVDLADGRGERLDAGGGVATASGTPDALVVEHAGLEGPATAELRAAGRRTTLRSLAARPPLAAAPELARLGERRLASALLRPSWHDGREPLPVLLDPYGGPYAQRVLRSEGAFLASQWFAEAGFAVLVTDGRGSPGRGPAWEEAIAGDLASAPLADQVDALGA